MNLLPAIQTIDKALAYFSARASVPSAWRTAQWAEAPIAIVNRAFFSAGVESANFLQAAQSSIGQALAGARDAATGALMNRERFIVEMRQRAISLGIAKPDGDPADLQNLAGERRIGMIYDMNRDAAMGRARRASGLSEGALFAAPAQELIRGRIPKIKARDWLARWKAVGGPENALPRMIALKTDPVWQRLSRFGTPWPPFDFGSGMILRNISRSEAIRYGLLEEEQLLQPPRDPGFNDELQASLINVAPSMLNALKTMLPQIKIADGKAVLA